VNFRRVLCAAALVAFSFGYHKAQAQPFASMPNKNGGVITLRDEACDSLKGWFSASAFDDKTGYTSGCWNALDDHQIIVLWSPKPDTLFPMAYETNHFVKLRAD
jgi:hypothetical protein